MVYLNGLEKFKVHTQIGILMNQVTPISMKDVHTLYQEFINGMIHHVQQNINFHVIYHGILVQLQEHFSRHLIIVKQKKQYLHQLQILYKKYY